MKELMTVKEFLENYSISRRVFYYEVKKKKIKIKKLGSRTLIHREDAEAWAKTLGGAVL